ncbi:hypothetical protein L207DRAFT_564528 [Hyaloscypha variabilis F]|uniref:DUF7580 domain-containing protein n=1 Tax=Hyaloscypha variabilis (strain UAMH 11265 / GT02V1 / F) TaxID=1149755 RepID=A0A2J6RUE4_HYAVF|nr:hypothetical protein L207DRAFT_564528 [Hyaloscypha variabilis F]
MTGVEAAGFVLGILPLMISAAEHYEDVFGPFNRYRKFAPELELYQQQLGTQKTIFRNECHLLLATLTNRQTAKDMLREGKHPSWDDPDLNERFSRQLGDSGVACKNIINLMRGKLGEIEEKTESFGLVLQQSFPLSSIGDKAWRSRIGKRLKFSFSESRLEKTLEDLRNLNQDFRTLAAQTNKLDGVRQLPMSSSNSSLRTENEAVKDYRLVRTASAQLHQALEQACKIHEKHTAHFRLESKNVTIDRPGGPIVRFNMAFAHCSSRAPITLEPVWIAVDSTFSEALSASPQKARTKSQQEAQDRLVELSGALKRENSTSCPSPVKRVKGRTVRFDTTASSAARPGMTTTRTTTTTTTTFLRSFLTDSTLPDFCIQRDFCKQLEGYGPNTLFDQYIGFLEKSGPYKHLVCFAPPITTTSSRQSFSLSQIIHTVSKNPHADHFLQYERLRLGRQLASAVLQFHATPMLKDSWCSDDVVFFGTDASSTAITSPHLSVQLGKINSIHSEKRLWAENTAKTALTTHPFIRNPYLFTLGIILIELARQAPLSALREQHEVARDGPTYESKFSAFEVADRVSKNLGSSLGASYAKVVRKCLGCDFGEGETDLSDPGLQAVFYRDVVCELERLERAFAGLQLAA